MNGFVYFFLRPKAGTVKVGFSINPERRLAQIQTGCDERLQCIAIIEGTRSLEREFHRLMASEHLSGEWFVMTDRVLGFLVARLRSEAKEALLHADALADWWNEGHPNEECLT